ncbi:ABC transporter ATP-binding protein/permease [Nocardia ninae]|uniref:Putative ATP-binding protein ABC transporter CydD n=1 Tax=Nocardia ninae NBRC 108245 TaxID=1210091 RepID=A0A511MDC7_9NOCA|nr:ABC transporter ATP-binding protein/permease [Nocardia ninae]GEM38589.1 putative ATP-binding protein ABC transporter CydD [Nocardia ninae NBRC 108245]
MARPPVDPRLWRYARSARRYLVLSVALSVVITGSIVVAAVMLARVLSGVVTDPGQRSLGAWTTELLVLVLAIACRVLATWLQSRLAHRAGAGVVAELETAVLTAGARLPPRELETRRTDLAVVVGTGLSGLRGYLIGYVPALLLAVLVPPIVLAVIAIHDPLSGLIVVITLPLIPIFMILIGLLTQGRAEATLAATTRLSDQLLDLFAGMPTLQALGRERGGVVAAEQDHGAAHSSAVRPGTMADRVRALGDALRQRTMRALRIAFLSSMVLELLATLSVALIAVSIGLRLVFGEMSLYAGLVALVLAPEVYLPLRMVGERFHAAQDGMAAADKAFAVLESVPGAPESDGPDGGGAAGAGGVAPVRVGGVVELHELSVRARGGFAPDGLSALLRPGVVTVLAGPNGSGKSTAVQAILGLIEPDQGAVTIDGVDVRELDQDAWWARVAWLPQRPVLVPGTLLENLELFGAQAEPSPAHGPARVVDDLEAACVATGFDTVLDELPDRWDTVVGPGGVGLSLGQRQRLALTRVLAADRPILLLDEPTAHLDADSETAVLAALKQRARDGATVIVIGHRPTVLAAADQVIRVRASIDERAEVGV